LIASLVFLLLGLRSNSGGATISANGFDGFGVESSNTKGETVFLPPLPIEGLVLLANMPQLLLSWSYFLLNGVLTRMLTAAEWLSFSIKRKALRVSSPKGQQNSTYRLQLPFRYSIPLLVTMTVLHWTVSQSLFLSRIIFYEGGVELKYLQQSSLGYSTTAILVSIIIGFICLATVIGLGAFNRYPTGLPPLNCGSLDIATACQSRAENEDIALGRIKWGVISVDEDGTRHNGFSGKILGEV
jgi:hypothetical protein